MTEEANGQLNLIDDNREYEQFVEKFKPKKTTDDCYTPPEIYDVIRDWACAEYGIQPDTIVRPFYPGGDYEKFEYAEGCTVLDNPPFSILTAICEFYLSRGIRFFLFAPSLTCFSGRKTLMRMNHIVCDCQITYDNGAVVKTSFVTNLGDPDIIAQTAPELTKLVNAANAQRLKGTTRTLPKYEYPDNIVTAAMMQKYALRGIDFRVRRADCVPIYVMDAQRPKKKEIFGGGLLLSERAAAERAAAERAAAERAAAERAAAERAAAERAAAERAAVNRWQLSEREKAIVETLGIKSESEATK